MRRQRRNASDEYSSSVLLNHSKVFLENLEDEHSHHRFENTIEAKVEEDDTLPALALRHHTTVAEIKRLNKIDKDNEIHARKVIKIPVTIHSVLLQTLPTVHKSGSNSPRQSNLLENIQNENNLAWNPLDDEKSVLNEKLLIASVNAGGDVKLISNNDNYTIMNQKKFPGNNNISDSFDDENTPMLNNLHDDTDEHHIHLRPIPGPTTLRAFDWSGADCDMSWVCLLVTIIALCFVIPLVCVIYLAEHPHTHNNFSQ